MSAGPLVPRTRSMCCRRRDEDVVAPGSRRWRARHSPRTRHRSARRLDVRDLQRQGGGRRGRGEPSTVTDQTGWIAIHLWWWPRRPPCRCLSRSPGSGRRSGVLGGVKQVGFARQQDEVEVDLAIVLVADERDGAADGEAGVADLQPVGVVDVGERVTRSAGSDRCSRRDRRGGRARRAQAGCRDSAGGARAAELQGGGRGRPGPEGRGDAGCLVARPPKTALPAAQPVAAAASTSAQSSASAARVRVDDPPGRTKSRHQVG